MSKVGSHADAAKGEERRPEGHLSEIIEVAEKKQAEKASKVAELESKRTVSNLLAWSVPGASLVLGEGVRVTAAQEKIENDVLNKCESARADTIARVNSGHMAESAVFATAATVASIFSDADRKKLAEAGDGGRTTSENRSYFKDIVASQAADAGSNKLLENLAKRKGPTPTFQEKIEAQSQFPEESKSR